MAQAKAQVKVSVINEPKTEAPGFFTSFKRSDVLLIYGLTIAAWAIFFTSYLFGINSEWYASIIPDNVNVWIPRILWIVTTIISYLGLYILWGDATARTFPFYLAISVLFLIGQLLAILWAVGTYQGQNLVAGAWLSAILFLYIFWIATYIWNFNKLAAILIVPLVLMYGYLFYSMVHLAAINDAPI